MLRVALAMAIGLAATAGSASEVTTAVSCDALGRLGPAGAILFAGVSRRWTAEPGTSPLMRETYEQVGASAGISPAYAQASFAAEWVPVAVLQLRLGYDLYGFFGANRSLLRLPSKDSRFGDRELDALAGKEETGAGHRLTFSPTLRARLGPAVFRNETDLEWYALSRAPGWYYETENDTLIARRDSILVNRTMLLADLWDGRGGGTFLIGPMYDVTRSAAAAIVRQRLGVALSYLRAERLLGLDRIRVYALGGVNLADRNREGRPFVGVGVGGNYDLKA